MEIQTETYNKLLDFIAQSKKNKTYELEARFMAQKKI